jgi:hypothetical protein
MTITGQFIPAGARDRFQLQIPGFRHPNKIHHFAMERLSKDKEQLAPEQIRLSLWKRLRWIPIRIRDVQDGQLKTVLLNIGSVAKRSRISRSMAIRHIRDGLFGGFIQFLPILQPRGSEYHPETVDRAQILYTALVKEQQSTSCSLQTLTTEFRRLHGLIIACGDRVPMARKLDAFIKTASWAKTTPFTNARCSKRLFKKRLPITLEYEAATKAIILCFKGCIGRGSFKKTKIASTVTYTPGSPEEYSHPAKEARSTLHTPKSVNQLEAQKEINFVRRFAGKPGIIQFCGTLSYETRRGKKTEIRQPLYASDLLKPINAHSLSSEEKRVVTRQLLVGLSHVHADNVIHRDIKPENILIRGRGANIEAVITDFGLSCETQDEHAKQNIVGTPNFFAPKQMAYWVDIGGRYTLLYTQAQARIVNTPAVDIYAMGKTLQALWGTGSPMDLLTHSMMHTHPTHRPDAAMALQMFDAIN